MSEVTKHEGIKGGIGHNLPQQATQAFAQALSSMSPTSERPQEVLLLCQRRSRFR